MLPFVGPSAGLPLWRALGTLPFDAAGRIWGGALAVAMLVVVFGALALADAPRKIGILLGATIFAGSFGPLTSDVALGQVALLSGAGIVAALLLLQSRAWLAAALAMLVAALQPNLALVLAARLTDRRAWLALGLGAVLFAALTLGTAGTQGIIRYAGLLAAHGAAERFAVIQITPGAIAFGFGASPQLANVLRITVACAALVVAIAAMRALRDPVARVGIAICALPFVLPFFHEHDFLLALLPASYCALHARGRALGFAACAAVACGVDWLGLGQRPNAELQSVILASACALGFALTAGLRREAFAGLAIPVAVALCAVVARVHPVPIWPDAMPAHWQAPGGAEIARVWQLEQHEAGLDVANPAWALLRSFSLVSSGLLACALLIANGRGAVVRLTRRRDVRAVAVEEGVDAVAVLASRPHAEQ